MIVTQFSTEYLSMFRILPAPDAEPVMWTAPRDTKWASSSHLANNRHIVMTSNINGRWRIGVHDILAGTFLCRDTEQWVTHALSRDGSRLIYIRWADRGIVIVDIATLEVVREIAVPAQIYFSEIWERSDGLIAVVASAWGAPSLAALVDPNSGRVDMVDDVGAREPPGPAVHRIEADNGGEDVEDVLEREHVEMGHVITLEDTTAEGVAAALTHIADALERPTPDGSPRLNRFLVHDNLIFYFKISGDDELYNEQSFFNHVRGLRDDPDEDEQVVADALRRLMELYLALSRELSAARASKKSIDYCRDLFSQYDAAALAHAMGALLVLAPNSLDILEIYLNTIDGDHMPMTPEFALRPFLSTIGLNTLAELHVGARLLRFMIFCGGPPENGDEPLQRYIFRAAMKFMDAVAFADFFWNEIDEAIRKEATPDASVESEAWWMLDGGGNSSKYERAFRARLKDRLKPFKEQLRQKDR